MEQLGIQPIQLVTQIINFVVLVFLLKKFLYKPILKMLDERKKKIEEGLHSAQEMKKELAQNQEKQEELLKLAREEGRSIVDEARKTAKKVGEDIVEEAKKESAAVVVKGKQEVEAQKKQLEKSIQEDTVTVASAIVEKLIGSIMTEKEQKHLIDKRIKELASHVT